MNLKYFFLLVLITISCRSKDNTLFEINPSTFTDNRITLKEIADDIFYVPLDNSIPIGLTYKLKITADNIYISVKDVGIIKFDRSGKLIRRIGSKGRGPGDYNYFMDYTVDEITGNVFVMDRSVIKVYSQTGLFVRDIKYNEYLSNMGGDIEIFNSLLFIPDYIQYGNSKYNWIFLDTLGNVISKKENTVPIFTTDMVLPGQIYKFENKLFYFNYLNDTIFSISPDLQCRAFYLFAQGDYRYPKKYFAFDFTKLSNYFRPFEMFETKHCIFLSYSYKGRAAISVIDKKTKKIFLGYKNIKNTTMPVKTIPLIENDLDAGLPFSTRSIINYYEEKGSEYIISLINPFDLKVYLSTNDFKNTIPKFPEKKKELEKLANRLKETDNPVLMFVRLKK
jgi:6-bladed beta-propeller